MKPDSRFSAVRRGIVVETETTRCPSSVGAASPDVAPDGAGEFIGWRCYNYAAPTALPPKRIRLSSFLAEQKRIVARVEELLRWRATLEAPLHQTRTLGAHLAV
jgi:hypothetical protein